MSSPIDQITRNDHGNLSDPQELLFSIKVNYLVKILIKLLHGGSEVPLQCSHYGLLDDVWSESILARASFRILPLSS